MIKFPRTTLLASLLGLALAVPAVAQDAAPQGAEAPMSHALSAVDQKVVSESLHAGRKEIEAARLAKSRSSNEAIRGLATDIERDHTGLNERLEGIGGGVRAFAEPATADERAIVFRPVHPVVVSDGKGVGLAAGGQCQAGADKCLRLLGHGCLGIG